jgi:hypothetical protein
MLGPGVDDVRHRLVERHLNTMFEAEGHDVPSEDVDFGASARLEVLQHRRLPFHGCDWRRRRVRTHGIDGISRYRTGARQVPITAQQSQIERSRCFTLRCKLPKQHGRPMTGALAY